MANSNENTQNPKENQEKMADEGIQKHSEHTAANKQPESEDNVQNKNKPTRLCNFLKNYGMEMLKKIIKTQRRRKKMPQKTMMLQNRKK